MAPSNHALLGASSAHRWLLCTPSAVLETQFEDKAGEAAREGTLAHSIVETKLSRMIEGKPRGAATDEQRSNPLYTPAMEDHCDSYVDFVEELFNGAKRKTKDALLCSEMRVDFSRWVPGGFGTTDTTIIADDTITVIDFKFGKGHLVEARENPQLRLYALGALEEFGPLYDIQNVRTYIVQPRKDSITSEDLTADEVLTWAENYVKPRAELAAKGLGEKIPGAEQCLFCRAKNVCVARISQLISLMQYQFKNPDILSPEEIAAIIPYAEALASWSKGVKDYALAHAVDGEAFPGYKLVQGRSNRKITDDHAAIEALLKAGADLDKIVRLRSLTDLEGYLSKDVVSKVLGDLIVKPEGKPTLVPESDKREPVKTVEPVELFDVEENK